MEDCGRQTKMKWGGGAEGVGDRKFKEGEVKGGRRENVRMRCGERE